MTQFEYLETKKNPDFINRIGSEDNISSVQDQVTIYSYSLTFIVTLCCISILSKKLTLTMHEVVKMAFNYNISCINKKATGEKKKRI